MAHDCERNELELCHQCNVDILSPLKIEPISPEWLVMEIKVLLSVEKT